MIGQNWDKRYWSCLKTYHIAALKCSHYGAINANTDPDGAQAQSVARLQNNDDADDISIHSPSAKQVYSGSLKGDCESVAKFSKGPWRVYETDIDDANYGIDSPDGTVIVFGVNGEACGVDKWPNACLIAAAPRLFNALQAMLDRYVSLVNSGDAGNWDPQIELEVIEATFALKSALGEHPAASLGREGNNG